MSVAAHDDQPIDDQVMELIARYGKARGVPLDGAPRFVAIVLVECLAKLGLRVDIGPCKQHTNNPNQNIVFTVKDCH